MTLAWSLWIGVPRWHNPAVKAVIAGAFLAFMASCSDEPGLGPSSSVARNRGATAQGKPDSSVTIVVDDPGLPVKTRDGWIRGYAIPEQRRFSRDNARQIVEEQLRRYPPRLLERVGLKKVVLCDELTFEGSKCVAFADVEHGSLYVNAEGSYGADFLKRTLHHEIFHQFDFADDGSLQSDARWEALNPPGFRYAHNAQQSHNEPGVTLPDDNLNGFLNRYSMSSPTEDKSELFASLIVEYDLVCRRMERDDSIRRKVERIEEILEKFGPYSRVLFDH